MARKRNGPVSGTHEGISDEMQKLIHAHLSRFPKLPDQSLPLEASREALLVFDVPKRKVAGFAPRISGKYCHRVHQPGAGVPLRDDDGLEGGGN